MGEWDNMNTKRSTNEDIRDYKIRLAKNKDVYGLSWEDIAVLLNYETGNNYGESAYRKEIVPFLAGMNFQVEKSLGKSDSDLVNEIEEKTRELKKERVKVQTEKLEYNKWIREQSRMEMFEDNVVKAINDCMYPLDNIPKINDSDTDINDRASVLLISDMHYGKDYEIKGLKGEILNSYSPEIFEDRMWSLLETVVRNLKKENMKHLHIFNLADSIDGILRANSQLMKLRYGILDSAMLFTNFMANWLNELSRYVTIDYYQSTGNHSDWRILDGGKGNYPHENAERMIGWALTSMLKDNDNITIHEEEIQGLIYTNILGFDILASHGDKEKKNLENSIKDYVALYNCNIDYFLVGHKHHAMENNVAINKEIIQAPSIIGIDDFSVSLKKSANAGAKMFILEKDYGRYVDYNIKLN